MDGKNYFYSHYMTPLGAGAVAASDQGICRVWLPGDELPDTALRDGTASKETREAAQQLEQYFQNGLQHFDMVIDISSMTCFQQQVLRLTRQIPYGEVRSYGELACLLGLPKGARAVGGALGANPVPVIIPCHRVVAADGALTGFSAATGLRMKEFLLGLEGIEMQGIKTGGIRVVINKKKI